MGGIQDPFSALQNIATNWVCCYCLVLGLGGTGGDAPLLESSDSESNSELGGGALEMRLRSRLVEMAVS